MSHTGIEMNYDISWVNLQPVSDVAHGILYLLQLPSIVLGSVVSPVCSYPAGASAMGGAFSLPVSVGETSELRAPHESQAKTKILEQSRITSLRQRILS